MVDQSAAVPAQKNCLLDLIKTAIAGKTQQYLGAGFNQSMKTTFGSRMRSPFRVS